MVDDKSLPQVSMEAAVIERIKYYEESGTKLTNADRKNIELDVSFGHASGRRSGEAEWSVAREEHDAWVKAARDERDSYRAKADKLTAERNAALERLRGIATAQSTHAVPDSGIRMHLLNHEIDKLTAELAEARALVDGLEIESKRRFKSIKILTQMNDDYLKDRNALQSQLTQAQADVAELTTIAGRALAICTTVDGAKDTSWQNTRMALGNQLARVKGGSR